MGILGYFSFPNTYTTDKWLRRDLREINEISQKKLSEMQEEELSRLFFLHERSSLSLRRYLEEKETKKDVNLFDFDEHIQKRDKHFEEKSYLKNLPVSVERRQGITHIHLPYLFDKGMREAFTVANYMDVKLKTLEDKGFSFITDEKVVMVFLRISKEKPTARFKDNDNFEARRIINTMFEHLGMSDNVNRMSFFSDYMESPDEKNYGTHIFVVPYRKNFFSGEKLMEMFKQ